jgi:M6 family metalloprotease-like protein
VSAATGRFRTALPVALALLAGATASLAGEVTVRRVAPAATVSRAARRGVALAARPMTAEQERVLALRAARQRAFLPYQRRLLAPELDVDRSLAGARRQGWRPPASRASALPAAIEGASPPGLVDTVRMAFIRVDFLHDRGGAASTGDGKFDLSGPDTTVVPIDRPPHNRKFYVDHAEALRRFYWAQSFGHVYLDIDVWPAEEDSAYHLSDMADLGPWAFGSSDAVYRAAVKMFRQMFFAADAQGNARGQSIPWQKYDRYMMIHAGSDLQSDVRADSKEDIPTFTIFLGDTDRVIFPDSAAWNKTRPIDRCAMVPETSNQDGYYAAINGVVAHENGHNLFGFLDVYDVDTGLPTVGLWSLMDSGNLAGSLVILPDSSEIFAIGMLPPSVDAFQRQFIGITTTPMNVRWPSWAGTDSLIGNERSDAFTKVPLSSDEFLLLENRFLAPGDTLLHLASDPANKVVLGPLSPDTLEYDALLPGGGILVWHVDESVVPYDRSLRVNPDYGLNTNRGRLGLQVIEADGLDDLGDLGSPFLLGSVLDPWQHWVNPVLSDSTQPNLIPNQGTRPHIRIDFLDDASDTMHFTVRRFWSLPAFPVVARFPAGGPVPLAIDADGNRDLDICWAGADTLRADTTALFAVRPDGQGLAGPDPAFAHLDRRPRPALAAVATGDPTSFPPAVFAATTFFETLADTVGGRVWLVDHAGAPLPGWPVRLPSVATTPPLIAGAWPNVAILVGAADGYVYALDTNGATVARTSTALPGGVAGHLAFWQGPPQLTVGTPAPADTSLLAAGGAAGDVGIFRFQGATPMTPAPGWPQHLWSSPFDPDFLWIRFGGEGGEAEGNCSSTLPTLVAHHADRLWAFCPSGSRLPGWGASFGDTIVAGLAAGDPDGDGFPEVLVQTMRSQVAFLNRDGHPTPGWPRASTTEKFRTSTPALALDVDHDGRSEIVTMNASGVISALRADGRTPEGWPLATGVGAAGAILAADLDRNGSLEIVAPDRDTMLYAYSVPVPANDDVATSWTVFGGDPGRTFSLPAGRTPTARAAAAGPLVRGSLKAFPNPARRRPVTFAYTLSEDAQVDFRILDSSGHEVASFSRAGERSENVVTWDPGALPSGLYTARVRFAGARGSRVEFVPVGLLR